MSRKRVCTFFRPVTWKVIKIFHFSSKVWAWQGRHFERLVVNNKMLITSLYFVLYAPDFNHFTRVPAWTHLCNNIHSWFMLQFPAFSRFDWLNCIMFWIMFTLWWCWIMNHGRLYQMSAPRWRRSSPWTGSCCNLTLRYLICLKF